MSARFAAGMRCFSMALKRIMTTTASVVTPIRMTSAIASVAVSAYGLSAHTMEDGDTGQRLTGSVWIAQQYIRWRGLDPPEEFKLSPIKTKVRNDELYKQLKKKLENKHCPLVVFYAPHHYGKTLVIRHCLRELCAEEKIKGCVYVDGSGDVGQYTTLRKWFWNKLGLNWKTTSTELSSLLPEAEADGSHVVVVLDQFNEAATHPDLKSFIPSLAADAHVNKNYLVVVIVSDFYMAERILDMNGSQKIISAFDKHGPLPQWNRSMLTTLLKEQVDSFELKVCEDDQKQLLDWAEHLGLPGYLLTLVSTRENDNTINMKKAKDLFEKCEPANKYPEAKRFAAQRSKFTVNILYFWFRRCAFEMHKMFCRLSNTFFSKTRRWI
eukprot:m.42383 g.42383  ORF g.42383 m.42383 type:complete len:381 (+) comp10507_c1_seq2:68-1210(+)